MHYHFFFAHVQRGSASSDHSRASNDRSWLICGQVTVSSDQVFYRLSWFLPHPWGWRCAFLSRHSSLILLFPFKHKWPVYTYLKMHGCFEWSCEKIARKLIRKIVKYHNFNPKLRQLVEDLLYECSHIDMPDLNRRLLVKEDIELYFRHAYDNTL